MQPCLYMSTKQANLGSNNQEFCYWQPKVSSHIQSTEEIGCHVMLMCSISSSFNFQLLLQNSQQRFSFHENYISSKYWAAYLGSRSATGSKMDMYTMHEHTNVNLTSNDTDMNKKTLF